MLVLVCGSRSWLDGHAIYERLDQLPQDTTIMTGGASGADNAAYAIALELCMQTKEMPAEWEKYGKRAGYLRNIAMLDEKPDLVIAFWDGESRGTKHTIDEARKRGIETEVVLA